MKKILFFLLVGLCLSCSSDGDNDSSSSTLKISGENYAYDDSARADVSDLLIADPDSKTVFFYITEQLPCSAAPCRRPIGMSIRVVAPLSQSSLAGSYSLDNTNMPYATIHDYKTDSNSVSGSMQITQQPNGNYRITFSEGTVLQRSGNETLELEGFEEEPFAQMQYDYRTATGWSN